MSGVPFGECDARRGIRRADFEWAAATLDEYSAKGRSK